MRIRRDRESEDAILNISSLLDVLFILIIFFLATSSLAMEEKDLEVSLPEASLDDSLQ